MNNNLLDLLESNNHKLVESTTYDITHNNMRILILYAVKRIYNITISDTHSFIEQLNQAPNNSKPNLSVSKSKRFNSSLYRELYSQLISETNISLTEFETKFDSIIERIKQRTLTINLVIPTTTLINNNIDISVDNDLFDAIDYYNFNMSPKDIKLLKLKILLRKLMWKYLFLESKMSSDAFHQKINYYMLKFGDGIYDKCYNYYNLTTFIDTTLTNANLEVSSTNTNFDIVTTEINENKLLEFWKFVSNKSIQQEINFDFVRPVENKLISIEQSNWAIYESK